MRPKRRRCQYTVQKRLITQDHLHSHTSHACIDCLVACIEDRPCKRVLSGRGRSRYCKEHSQGAHQDFRSTRNSEDVHTSRLVQYVKNSINPEYVVVRYEQLVLSLEQIDTIVRNKRTSPFFFGLFQANSQKKTPHVTIHDDSGYLLIIASFHPTREKEIQINIMEALDVGRIGELEKDGRSLTDELYTSLADGHFIALDHYLFQDFRRVGNFFNVEVKQGKTKHSRKLIRCIPDKSLREMVQKHGFWSFTIPFYSEEHSEN